MTLLHIAECAGGVERYLAMLLPLIQKSGVKQYLICSQDYDKDKFGRIVDGVEQLDLRQSFSPFYVLKKVFQIRNRIRRIMPDVLYCHSSFAGGLGRIAALGLKCKIVYNPHGWAFNIV